MSSPLNPDAKVIALAGDWHANSWKALEQIDRAHAAGADVIVQLGDFGYGTPVTNNRRYLVRVERRLAELDRHLVWLDGNHEDQDRLDAKEVNPVTGLRDISPHIHHLPRGVRWRFGEQVWMALGGAVSVDKRRLRPGKDWWPQEALSQADVERAMTGGSVDVLLSHDAPPVEIRGLSGDFEIPADVLAEAEAHRTLLGTVVEAVRPRQVWHGHMHVRHDAEIDLGWREDRPDWDGVVQVHGLDSDRSRWDANLTLVGPDGARLPWPDDALVARLYGPVARPHT